MNGLAVSRDNGVRLASYIEAKKRELIESVARSPVLARPSAIDSGTLASAFLDCLREELQAGDEAAVNVWADVAAGPAAGAERARVVVITCAVVSAGFVAESGHSDEIITYLALRSVEIEKRFVGEKTSAPVADDSGNVKRNEVVASLLSAMEARDHATCDHSRAVGMWCNRIAKTIGMSVSDQAAATLAGTLHDVGKIATPAEILLKAGPLDAAEWKEMRAHAQIGGKMLERIPSLRDLAGVVRAHHERIDGRGYPDGLAGEAIPVLARVVAVADSFHAMISKRPYREAMQVGSALDELRAGSGSQFDPDVVDAMLQIVRPSRARPVLRLAVGGER
jgi:HD-GYP domain-containing protein (c-di-GMP phosphodiesterase class II)